MGVETILAIGMSAAGSLMSAVGGIKKGEATNEAAQFNAAADRQRAAQERDAAAAQAQDLQRKGSQTEATAVADVGAAGVTGEGSPLMVHENTVRQVALGVARTLATGKMRSDRLEQDAQLNIMKGENAVEASYYDAGASLLSGGGKIASALIPGKGSIA